MKISARNRLKDKIVDYRRNGRAFARGKTAYAVIKMSDFMVELD
jgi:molybdopterin-binding protein